MTTPTSGATDNHPFFQQREAGQVYPIILDTGASVSVSLMISNGTRRCYSRLSSWNVSLDNQRCVWRCNDDYYFTFPKVTYNFLVHNASLLVTDKACYFKSSDKDTETLLTIPYNPGKNHPKVEFTLAFGSFSSTNLHR